MILLLFDKEIFLNIILTKIQIMLYINKIRIFSSIGDLAY